MKKSIVLLVLFMVLMFTSTGYSGNYYGDYFVAKDFSKKENPNSHDMSISTSTPQVQSNKGCAGPYNYELLNREPDMVLNEMWENGKAFCKFHANDGIDYFETMLLEQVIMLWTLEEMYNRVRTNDPVKNKKLKAYFANEIAKQKMVLNLADGQFRQLEINYRPGRYQLWMDTISKYRHAWKTNKRTRLEMDKIIGGLLEKVK